MSFRPAAPRSCAPSAARQRYPQPAGRGRTLGIAGLAAAIAALPSAASAHAGADPAPHDLWLAWSAEPAVLLGIGLVVATYARGIVRLRRRAAAGRGLWRGRVAAFAAGIVAVVVALVSPLDYLSASLFSAHMVQHLLLVLVAAPLLVLGVPLAPFLWALPARGRRRIGRWWKHSALGRGGRRVLDNPPAVWTLQAAALWVWHLPVLYQAALDSELIHALEHASLLGTAGLFWFMVVPAGRRRLSEAAAILYVFAAAVQSGLLGILLAFARTPWYPAYVVRAESWGVSPLTDQQLAGLIMWIPAGVVYGLAALIHLGRWLEAAEPGGVRFAADERDATS